MFSGRFSGTSGTITITGYTGNVTFSYPYYCNGYKEHKQEYANIEKIKELQKILLKHPNRTDIKMELIRLQKLQPQKVGRKKKGKK